MTEDLFSQSAQPNRFAPLAARLRPETLEHYIGQQHLLAPDKPLRCAIEQGQIHSMIFWGPPGVGKTTLAKLLSREINAQFLAVSAVLAGVKDIRAAVSSAQQQRQMDGRATILFVDEVHRFNKSQQDAFLPYVEDGTLIFVGATTENPSFEVNNALLSRCRVYVLQSFSEPELQLLLQRALSAPLGLGDRQLRLSAAAAELLCAAADGDARRALNLLEIAADLVENA
ncbi:MAG: AAA family ATPase, partial [Cellvibrionaceae bacterium]|nr:AAA family ATPase [Cellvibrionaceae bacterium]